MSDNDIKGLIIVGIVVLILVVFAIILLSGKGTFLISGLNASNEREKYDSKALGKFIGIIILIICVLLFLDVLFIILGITWISVLCILGIIVLAIFTAIYCNTNQKFKKRSY